MNLQASLPEAVTDSAQVQGKESFAELADAVAQDFINYVGNDMEFIAIMRPWDTHKPDVQCFDYWHKKNEFVATSEAINKCQLWAKELAWLFGTYGYEVKPMAFKSERLWSHIKAYTESDELKDYYAKYKANRKLRNPSCPTREQKGWTEQKVIPWGSDRPSYCDPGESW